MSAASIPGEILARDDHGDSAPPGAADQQPSAKSVRALDFVNVFMADVKDGVGIYLAVYLLAEHHWRPGDIGIVMSLPWLIGILVQPLVGALIDNTTYKRHLLVAGSAAIAFSAVIVIFWPSFWPMVAAQSLVGLFQAVYPPAVAAITLGMVGHARLPARIGRNESLNHAGNMLAAIMNVVMALYISYQGIFYFSILQCLAIIVSTLLIKENDIDHRLARAAAVSDGKEAAPMSVKSLLLQRNVVAFIAAMFLFNVANGFMLPMLGQKISVHARWDSSVYLSICIIIAQAVMVGVAWMIGKHADMGRKKLLAIALLVLPLRPILFSAFANANILTALQVLDGLVAGVYGVMIIMMTADLSRGTGRFNLLQGVVYSAVGLGMAASSVLAGRVAEQYGFDAGFRFLAGVSFVTLLFFTFFVKETKPAAGSSAAPASTIV